MSSHSEKLKPLIIFGIVLIFSSFVGIFMLYDLLNDPTFDSAFSNFLVCMIIVNLLTGLGVILKKSWGISLLKFYLYVLFLGVPIGTYISMKTLKYIRDNNLEKYFGNT